MVDENPLLTERWIEKTQGLVGVDLSVPAPVMRYQLLEGRVFTLQLFPDGSRAAGEIDRKDFEGFTGKPLGAEGWYNVQGEFLGDDPDIADA